MSKPTPAQSSQSLIVLERSNKGIQASVAAMKKAAEDLGNLVTQSEALTLQIEDKQAELAALTSRNDTAIREADAELRLRIKENREKVLSELLAESGLAKIPALELDALRKELASALAKDATELKAAVDQAVNAANREAASVAALKEAETKVAAAQKDATIDGLKDRVTFLTEQTKQLQGQIDSERATRLEIAKADSARQGVVIQQGKQ